MIGDYDTELFGIEDYDYWLRVARSFSLGWLQDTLYFYRRHSSSLTGMDNLKNRARTFDELQTRFFGPDPKRRSRVLSQYYLDEAFESHQGGNRKGVIRYLAWAIFRDVTFLSNRGVLSIALQALLGKTIMGGIRHLANPMLSKKVRNDH